MKKDKKIWICFPEMFLSLMLEMAIFYAIPIVCFVEGTEVTHYIFGISLLLIAVIISLFYILWFCQFIIFKDDYLIFGNVLKKELYRIKYDDLIIIKKTVLSSCTRFYKRSKELKKFEKDHNTSLKVCSADVVFYIFDNIKKFDLEQGRYGLLIGELNFHYKKRIIVYRTDELEEMFVEIQHSRGKYLDGSSMSDRKKPFWGDK